MLIGCHDFLECFGPRRASCKMRAWYLISSYAAEFQFGFFHLAAIFLVFVFELGNGPNLIVGAFIGKGRPRPEQGPAHRKNHCEENRGRFHRGGPC